VIPTFQQGQFGRRRIGGAGGAASSNTKRLFHFNGTNGSTSIIDTASTATVTANGNAQLSTSNPKFGSACLLLDGSGDWVKSANDAGLDFGSGEFCIEGFANWADTSNRGIFHLFPGTPSGSSDGIALAYNGSAIQLNTLNANSTFSYSPSTTPGNYAHWAVYRIVNTCYVALAGTVLGSRSLTGTVNGNDLNIGMYFSTGFTFNGRLDEIRVTNGSSVYTASNFTPPSAEFAYP